MQSGNPRRVPFESRVILSTALTRLAWAAAALTLLAAAPASAPVAMLGIPTIFVTRASDTLLDIAQLYDVGFVEIREANPGIDPWMPGAGIPIRVPTQHIIPNAPHSGIVINLAELRLYYFSPHGEVRSFPIGTGDEGKDTPVGSTRVVRKQPHPTWIPTESEHQEDPALPNIVGPGPDNPMGDFALYLAWSGYAVHGTNKPDSIGRRDSHGCIRLYPEDIEWLYHQVGPGVSVTVVNQPAKVAWSGGELYLEVHPLQDDIDAIELTGQPTSGAAIDADDLILKTADEDADRLDWYTIHLAEARRDGIPVQITRPLGGAAD